MSFQTGAAAFGCGAATIGVIFDKPASGKRTGTAGWYNTAAFEKCAAENGLYAKTINGDAFSKEVKEETIALIFNCSDHTKEFKEYAQKQDLLTEKAFDGKVEAFDAAVIVL